MRVKSVPRQRVYQGNRNTEPVSEAVCGKIEKSNEPPSDCEKGEVSTGGGDALKGSNEGTVDLNMNQVEDRSMQEKKEKEMLNYPEEALDMSIKPKTKTPEENVPLRSSIMAGPSCRYAELHSEEDTDESSNDDNNNSLPLQLDGNGCSSATCSPCEEDPCTHESKPIPLIGDDDDTTPEAINLCKKDCQEDDATTVNTGADERLKDTFLYKIMTDPTFLESIQKHKQSKRHTCQFCKREFPSSDELADHMDVKTDESNQVICCACKKTFAQKRYLRYHQRCHSERTMFTCDICTKKYTRMDNLSRHNAFHVNPDKFSCTYCEKTFARKDLLNKHLKCHDNKYRFFCEMCEKYFKGPLVLDNHRRKFHPVA